MKSKISNQQLLDVNAHLQKLTEAIAPALTFQKLLEMGGFGLKIKEAAGNLEKTIQLQFPEELKKLIEERNNLISSCSSETEKIQKLNTWIKESRFQSLYESYRIKSNEIYSQKNPETFNFKLQEKEIEFKVLGKDVNKKLAPHIECLSILLMND